MGTVSTRKLAVVTGASSGIGHELARQCVAHGFDVIACAEDDRITEAARTLEVDGARVRPVQADLATYDGVEELVDAVLGAGQPVDALLLNAGVGVGGRFLETDLDEELRMIGLNVAAVVHLSKRLLPHMVARGEGRVLITGSVASTNPAPYLAVYGGTKAFDLSFGEALRQELKDSGLTVTVLQPGATDTEFFERADMEDTKVAQSKKDDPADVARAGFEAMMAGKDSVYAASIKSKVMGLAGEVLPETTKAKLHGAQTRPGSGKGS